MHFDQLTQLYEKHRKKGLEIIAFPSNQFFQETKTPQQLRDFVNSYDASYPITARVDVNGLNTHPVFRVLKEQQSSIISKDIEFNFVKFLIDRNGRVVKRFPPTTTPSQMEQTIVDLL